MATATQSQDHVSSAEADQTGETIGRDTLNNDPHRSRRNATKKANQICRFYGTKKGCRAGDQCPYLHIQGTDSSSKEDVLPETSADMASTSEASAHAVPHNIKPRDSKDRKPVSKPVSSAQQTNPREFQINQVIRRFSPKREDNQDGTLLRLDLVPSDPDFPFELTALRCVLTVPTTYPTGARPTLKVENAEIPKGYQINVERGFSTLATGSSQKTLLALLNNLDRDLERLLSSEKAQTIKIVANRGRTETTQATRAVTPPPVAEVIAPHMTRPNYTTEQRTNAKAKRDQEVRQLEARMSRVPLFSSSKDGLSFNVPIQIPKPGRLPLDLQPLKEIVVHVPALYDLESCSIRLKGVAGKNAENVELAFEKYARQNRQTTLMAHVNYLTQHIHTMATETVTSSTQGNEAKIVPKSADVPSTSTIEDMNPTTDALEGRGDEERPHLRFVARPPEWSVAEAAAEEGEETTESESSDYEYTDEHESEDEIQAGGTSVIAPAATPTLEKGILISFPQMELTGIELLELRNLSLSVRCDRCKETMDIKNIQSAKQDSQTSVVRTETCNKCSSPLSASYRAELMHANTIKAGFLDLDGCTVVDMLPSAFLPTCSDCSTTQPLPGVISVRGETSLAVCRECHHKMTFKLPEIKFLRVSLNDSRINRALPPKRKKENLGISAGTELPEKGRCKHYSKSYRWFRFSCCNRVYPCDRCHDEKEEHPEEHANRMICGWCSREQNFRPEDCGVCGRSVIRRTGGGFWEGGKGTRDRAKMSRKEPRKYKRIGGSQVGSK